MMEYMEFTKDNGKTVYTICADIGDYTIMNRHTSFEPFVVAWHLHFWKEGNEYVWEQGHYFQDYISALTYAITQTDPTAILSAAINICDSVGKRESDIGFGIGDQLLDVINYLKEDEED